MFRQTKIDIKKIILFLLAFFIMFSALSATGLKPAFGVSTADELQRRINEKKASLAAGANERKKIENEIANLKNKQADAARTKRYYDELIAVIEGEIRETEEFIDLLKEAIEQTESDIIQAEEDYKKIYDVFLKLIKFAYEEGDVNYLELLLHSEDFTDFLSRIEIISNISEYNKNVIDNLVQSRADMESQKEFNEEMITQQNEYIQTLAEKSKEVAAMRDEAERTIKKLADDIAKSQAAQDKFDQESADLLAEINRASKELTALQQSERKYVGGNFKYPVTPKYANPVSSGFGTRISPITGRSEFHNGIDIPANYGSPIWAANDGIVIIATYSGAYGNYVVIDHGGGKSTLYAHASSLNVKVGARVSKGDVIAYVGSTGWSTGNHLHFSYMEYGVFKNPLTSGLL
ncbi:MAG: peptidoglycan DD-metalloendopeptidase family protein [Oscillospiraceae bacterium]|nr:peptidoglycan DD-metalloendopeptidase family protein [Oscillospiraceae bacterium]